MGEAYKLSSTERIQLLEKELATQLSELKIEIEENGLLEGSPSRSYSSVPVPKDISFYRKEREMILKKGLQVAEAKPVVMQADVMQEELESCLKREYTADSLPLLLHQECCESLKFGLFTAQEVEQRRFKFYIDRIHQLVTCKYLHMLRWKRFCRHTSVIDQLYPLYKKQISHIMREYDDAVQRARRLSAARESLLTGKGNPSNLVTQEDLVIYLQWLVCHLHSVRTIHDYLVVLQYLPISDRMEVTSEKQPEAGHDEEEKTSAFGLSESFSSFLRSSTCPSTALSSVSGSEHFSVLVGFLFKEQSSILMLLLNPFYLIRKPLSASLPSIMTQLVPSVSGLFSNQATDLLPRHILETEELTPQLQYLVSHFGIVYEVEDLRNTANEMELFTLVTRKFRSVFNKQQTMKTFPVYDASEPGSENRGVKEPTMALKKEANWVPFLKVKPKQDPWQQKQMTKLKQQKKIDEILQLQSYFLQSNITYYDNCSVWCIYNLFLMAVSSFTKDDLLLLHKKRQDAPLGKSGISEYSYTSTMQLLGLDEGMEDNSKDPVMMRGAYLSFLHLRHLRIRELQVVVMPTVTLLLVNKKSHPVAYDVNLFQRVCLGILNYFRSVERNLAFSTSGLTIDGGNLTHTAEDTCWVNATRGGSGTTGGLGSHYYLHNTPADYKVISLRFLCVCVCVCVSLSVCLSIYLSHIKIIYLCSDLQSFTFYIVPSSFAAAAGLPNMWEIRPSSSLPSGSTSIILKRFLEMKPFYTLKTVSLAKNVTGTGKSWQLHNDVHSTEFMEFSDVENHDDFYTVEEGYIHTQDQRGVYIIYDLAIKDLQELENQLLLVASQYIEKHRTSFFSPQDLSRSRGNHVNASNELNGTHAELFSIRIFLTNLVSCLKNMEQLLDSYFEAYQHVLDPEERFALAQVVTDIMHRRPRFDFNHGYFLDLYKDECICLRLHLQLIRGILNAQIDEQREYIQRLWRNGQKGSVHEFGLPLSIISKQLICINNSCSALKNIYLLEFHPSLGLASRIAKALDHVYKEFFQVLRPQTASEAISLDKQVLQLAVEKWLNLEMPESYYSSQVQKDLFSDIFMEDPFFVKEAGISILEAAEENEKKQGKEKRALVLDTFSKLLELITLRHRLIDAAYQTALLASLYKKFAAEMGFDEFHLFLRPVQFEFAAHKEKADQPPPVFITAVLEDDSSIDRYTPSNLLLGIQEVDENQIGKFSFHCQETVFQLLSKSGVESLQVALACQVAQKNALFAAVQQASLCHTTQPMKDKTGGPGSRSQDSSANGRSSQTAREFENQTTPPHMSLSVGNLRLERGARKRPPEAFVSIQLEKLGPRDMMLNTFINKKQSMGTVMKNLEEVERVKRELIVDYCKKFSSRMSQYALRGQIIAYYNSLTSLLENFPAIRNVYFMTGQSQEKKSARDSELGLQPDPRKLQQRPQCLLSADGRTFLNLWFIPHHSEVLIMFKTLEEKACQRALYLTLQIVEALYDIVSYLFSFAQLGNSNTIFSPYQARLLTADWGGLEGIGAELQEIQKQIDNLHNPADPTEVATMLMLRREVMFLQFDVAVRHLIREAFMSAGNVAAYQAVTECVHHALPPLTSSAISSIFGSQFPLPQPLSPHSHRAVMMYPWRAFLAKGGLFPMTATSAQYLEYNMQLALCRLSDRDQAVANGELLGVSLLMEDVLQNGFEEISFTLVEWEQKEASVAKKPQKNSNMKPIFGRSDQNEDFAEPTEVEQQCIQSRSKMAALKPLSTLQNPTTTYAYLKSFLILWKQLEVFKEAWGRLKLGVEDINTVSLQKQFSSLYRAEILYPAMKAIARQLNQEANYEGLVTDTHPMYPPKGASELELWKHPVMKENFSSVRPQIIENFVQKLMERHQDTKEEITFRKDHLHKCLTSLACDVMARERSNFETYSMFYEHVLRQEHQLLYQKEQEMKAMEDSQMHSEGPHVFLIIHSQIADLSHEMIVEITALRAKLSDLEEENQNLKEEIRKEVQNEYETLVRNLFMACFNLKSKLDEYRIDLNRQVYELINEVRKEGVENMIVLKKKIGSTK
uniref:DUF4549 domain-containing protein n=1 Tax=Latimeria chalumnae TaxID=7897 RepID=H3BDV7_LATCH